MSASNPASRPQSQSAVPPHHSAQLSSSSVQHLPHHPKHQTPQRPGTSGSTTGSFSRQHGPTSSVASSSTAVPSHGASGSISQLPPSTASLVGNKRTIYDRHLNRTRGAEMSRATFAYLFGEMVTYAQRRVTGIADLEKRLNNQGYSIGLKLLDLLLYRSPNFSNPSLPANTTLRPTHILPLLQFVSTALWKALFGRPADALERSQDNKDEYMITDNDPLVNTYISVPKEMDQLNCAAYVAGIVEGVCDGCGFPARVTAHSVGADDEGQTAPQQQQQSMWPGKTIFLVKFDEIVMEREEMLGQSYAGGR
ncbi:MAG: TRAPP subunit trs31 [Alyxoria varia]|nr:MAG: TRAPP subunit trs31 [Alyxoria varia]